MTPHRPLFAHGLKRGNKRCMRHLGRTRIPSPFGFGTHSSRSCKGVTLQNCCGYNADRTRQWEFTPPIGHRVHMSPAEIRVILQIGSGFHGDDTSTCFQPLIKVDKFKKGCISKRWLRQNGWTAKDLLVVARRAPKTRLSVVTTSWPQPGPHIHLLLDPKTARCC